MTSESLWIQTTRKYLISVFIFVMMLFKNITKTLLESHNLLIYVKIDKMMILRIALIGWGAVNIPLGVYTGLGLGNPDDLPPIHHDVSLVYEHMLAAIYITLAVCAILAAVDPIRHKLLIFFIIISSYAHAGIMTYDVMTTSLTIWDGLTVGTLSLYATGIVFTVLFPREIKKKVEE